MQILTHPLFLVGATAAIFQISVALYLRSNRAAILQPVLITFLAVSVFLLLLGIPYQEYQDGTAVLHMFLGPAIVALAVPLYNSLQKVRASFWPLVCGLLICTSLVALIGPLLAILAGLPESARSALLLRSVSAPIAIEVAKKIDGDVLITILSVISTGIIGTVIAPKIMELMKVRDERVQGFTFGLIAHAFGVARALEISPAAAAFATVAMGFAGCIAAFLVPLLMKYFGFQ